MPPTASPFFPLSHSNCLSLSPSRPGRRRPLRLQPPPPPQTPSHYTSLLLSLSNQHTLSPSPNTPISLSPSPNTPSSPLFSTRHSLSLIFPPTAPPSTLSPSIENRAGSSANRRRPLPFPHTKPSATATASLSSSPSNHHRLPFHFLSSGCSPSPLSFSPRNTSSLLSLSPQKRNQQAHSPPPPKKSRQLHQPPPPPPLLRAKERNEKSTQSIALLDLDELFHSHLRYKWDLCCFSAFICFLDCFSLLFSSSLYLSWFYEILQFLNM